MRAVIICLITTMTGHTYVSAKNEADSGKVLSKDSALTKKFNLHFQTTYIYQYKPAFHSPYNGANSLSGLEEKENSLTSTLFFGLRLWKGAEIYINPEIAGGSGLSGAYGLAASTNGETFRVGDPSPTLYLARGFLKQTIYLCNDKMADIDDAPNQLSCPMPVKYIQLLIGKLSLGDLFDNNVYSNSPRTQFMNWAIMNNAAYDYAANVRGYTYTFAIITQIYNTTYKAAIATLPYIANGAALNTNIGQQYSLNAELDKNYTLNGKKGCFRISGYYNNANMGVYKEAITGDSSGAVPNIVATRKAGRHKTGLGINTDLRINEVIGIFCRAGWDDGKTETWCYTESDQTFSTGLTINGKGWKRKDDNVGVAFVANGLSQEHRDYLAAGGLGFEIGDGKLNYGYETASEFYYSFKPVAYPVWISGDYQFIVNPGYNKDRGPVNVFSVRLHVEL